MKIADIFRPSGKESRRHRDAQTSAQSAEHREQAFLDHFRAHYAWMGLPFDRYIPAYRYAQSMADDGEIGGRRWPEIEDVYRRNWELSYPGTWSRFREAIHYGWELMNPDARR